MHTISILDHAPAAAYPRRMRLPAERPPAPGPATWRAARLAASLPLRLARRLVAGLRRRDACRDLLDWPDYLLADIGVSRDEIVAHLKRPLLRVPRHRQN